MPSNAIPAYGTLVSRGASPGLDAQTYTTIGEVKDINGPTVEVSVIDVTTHSSAASGNYREKIPSLIDPGTLEVDLNWVPSDATHALLLTDLTSRAKRRWQVQTVAGSTGISANMKMDGYVTGFPKTFPTDDVQGGKLTITITGAITTVVS